MSEVSLVPDGTDHVWYRLSREEYHGASFSIVSCLSSMLIFTKAAVEPTGNEPVQNCGCTNQRSAQSLCDHLLFLSLPSLDFSPWVYREFPGQPLCVTLNDINSPTVMCSAASLRVHYLPTSVHLCLFTKNKNKDSSKINLLEPYVMLLSFQTY